MTLKIEKKEKRLNTHKGYMTSTFYMSVSDEARFKQQCVKVGRTKSDVLRLLVLDWTAAQEKKQ